MEAAVVIDLDWQPIYYHTPLARTGGSLPDSHDLWEILWTNRHRLLGVAHSHPGGGIPGPSHTDVTTFAAVEAGLGVRLVWPIITVDAMRAFIWQGPDRLVYEEGAVITLRMAESWVAELLKLSA